jgi:hypothetical protein
MNTRIRSPSADRCAAGQYVDAPTAQFFDHLMGDVAALYSL